MRNGLIWSASSTGLRQIVQFGSLAILARLLDPSDYGLVAMSVAVVGLGAVMSDFSLGSALVQRKDVTDRHISTAFWSTAAIGTGMTVLLLLCTPLVGAFYGTPEVADVFRISVLSIMVRSFYSTDKNLLTKGMKFRTLGLLELIAQTLGSGLAIFLAWKGFGALSLAVRGLSEALVEFLYFTYVREWKLQPRIGKQEFKELWSFGGGHFGARILNYTSRNADNIIIGKVLGDVALGYYNLAYRLLFKPFQILGTVTYRVFFSGFSKLQDDLKRFKSAYLALTENICLILFPVGALFVALGPEIVVLLAGEKWLPAAPVVQIFGVTIFVQTVATPLGYIYLGRGRTNIIFRWAVLTSAMDIVSFLIGVRFGIIGVAIGYLAVESVLLIPKLIVAGRLIDLKLVETLTAAKAPFLAGLTAAIVGIYCKDFFLEPMGVMIGAGLSGVLMGAVYLGAILLLNRSLFHSLYRFARKSA